jgi:hypothetical protein
MEDHAVAEDQLALLRTWPAHMFKDKGIFFVWAVESKVAGSSDNKAQHISHKRQKKT